MIYKRIVLATLIIGSGAFFSTAAYSSNVLRFNTFGKGLEKNKADKSYFSNHCSEGTIKAALVGIKEGRQAAVCVCLDAEKGKGWYCWH